MWVSQLLVLAVSNVNPENKHRTQHNYAIYRLKTSLDIYNCIAHQFITDIFVNRRLLLSCIFPYICDSKMLMVSCHIKQKSKFVYGSSFLVCDQPKRALKRFYSP